MKRRMTTGILQLILLFTASPVYATPIPISVVYLTGAFADPFPVSGLGMLDQKAKAAFESFLPGFPVVTLYRDLPLNFGDTIIQPNDFFANPIFDPHKIIDFFHGSDGPTLTALVGHSFGADAALRAASVLHPDLLVTIDDVCNSFLDAGCPLFANATHAFNYYETNGEPTFFGFAAGEPNILGAEAHDVTAECSGALIHSTIDDNACVHDKVIANLVEVWRAGQPVPPTTPVPEPGSIFLAGVGFLMLVTVKNIKRAQATGK